MKLLAQFDLETRNTRFTLVVTGIPSSYYVARYWNVPSRSDANTVSAVTQQWSGEVTSSSMDEAVSMARAQIESLDGPIISKADGSTSSYTGASLKLAC